MKVPIPVPDPTHTIVPSHRVATWLLGHIQTLLNHLGLGDNHTLSEIVYVLVVALIALSIGMAVKWIILSVTRQIVAWRNSDIGRQLLKERTFTRCAHIVPPLVFMALIPFAFSSHSTALSWILRLTGVYSLIAFAIGLNAVITFIFNRYNDRENTRNLPLRGILNIGIGIVWIIVTILCIAVLIQKSPGALLAGLGAFAAALMLIFKDSILGFVAGIQMSQNDMLHVGDWIVVPSTAANGVVLDVSLSTVKIQNFDNTIVTVPPYTLVQGSFQNWRGMTQSGVRRIMQTLTVDYDGIAPLTPQLLSHIQTLYPDISPLVAGLVKTDTNGVAGNSTATQPSSTPTNSSAPSNEADTPTKSSERQTWLVNGDIRQPNGTTETNLGLFRMYLCQYLANNPYVAKDQRILVRLQQPTIYGIPLEVWCWADTTAWNAYESIQSAIIEHVTTVAPDFGLTIYSAGSDTITMAGQPSK